MAVEAKIAGAEEAHLAAHSNRANTLALQVHYHLHFAGVMVPKNPYFLQVDIKANHPGKLNQGVPIVQDES